MKKMFDSKGNIVQSGFNFKFNFDYKKSFIKTREERIKEWDFYQFSDGENIIQFVIANCLIFDNFFATYFNLKTKENYSISKLFLHTKKSLVLSENPETDFIYNIKKKDFTFSITNESGKKHIQFYAHTKKYKIFNFDVSFSSIKNKNRFTILHTFNESPKMFYLNFKENFFNANANIRVNDFTFKSNNLGGVLDWGRGYWPFNNEWYWGNFSTVIDNIEIGWNLGYGFGNLKETENVVYINGESIKLGGINSTIDANNPMKDIEITDDSGVLKLTMKAIYDNFTQTKILWLNKFCHQVYYITNGTISYQDKTIKITDKITFFEHEVNHW